MSRGPHLFNFEKVRHEGQSTKDAGPNLKKRRDIIYISPILVS